MIRRGYATVSRRAITRETYRPNGFVSDSEGVLLLRRMLREFAASARADGVVPIVFVANSFGYGNHLLRAVAPILEAEAIPHLSSHTVCSPSDPRCYLPDSHFLPEKDDEMAVEILRIIDEARHSPFH